MGVPRFDQPLVTQTTMPLPTLQRATHALPEVTVSPAGHEVAMSWAPASGATEVEIDVATFAVGPMLREVSGTLTASPKGAAYELTVPAHTRVRSIGLSSLRWAHIVDGELVHTQLRNQSDLGGALRITVAALDPSNQMVTRHAVPWVGPRNGVPGQFGGASFANSVLALTEMDVRRIQIGLVDQTPPEDWTQQDMELDSSVSAGLVTVAADVSLAGPDGSELWAFPGDYANVPAATVSFQPQIRAAFMAALESAGPLQATLVLTAATEAPIGFHVSGPIGSLVRRFATVEAVVLEGDPVVPLLVADGEPALDSELPANVTADMTITYAGIRLLESVADALPAPVDVHGHVVRAEPRRRDLPEAALQGVSVARVGLIGRAPEPCELSVQLVDTRRNGAPIGTPGVVQLDPHDDIRTVWVELPPVDVGDAAVAISAKATRGRFFWCANGEPLVRIAIHDPDPAGRTIRLGGTTIHALSEETAQLRGVTLPPAAFQSVAAAFESELFVTIDMADLLLRYAR